MSEQAQHPYSGYTVYRVLDKKQSRFLAVLVSEQHRTTIAYAKYVLETHLGRTLKLGYEAHHRDEDHTNDTIENLEEVEKNNHRERHTHGQTMVSGTCSYCGVTFQREKRNARLMRYCGRPCWRLARKGKQPSGFAAYRREKATEFKHGMTGYSHHGCRCLECTKANTERLRRYRDKKRSGG